MLGNHELNLLRGVAKAGNGWFLVQHRAEQQPGGEFAHSALASGGEHALAKPDMFAGLAPTDWMGPKRNVFCVEFSVGVRYEQRRKGLTTFDDTALAAMRWPERELWGEKGRVP